MGLYEQIKECAAKRGYSVNRLEQELGLPRSSLSKYNKSSPSFDKIKQIAEFLGMSVSELIGEDMGEDAYYLNEETRQIAQFAYENDGARILFNALRKTDPDNMKLVIDLVNKLS